MKNILAFVAVAAALTGCANMESESLGDIITYTRMACARGDVEKCRHTAIFLMNGDAATRDEAVDEFRKSCERLIPQRKINASACQQMEAELQRRPNGAAAVKRF